MNRMKFVAAVITCIVALHARETTASTLQDTTDAVSLFQLQAGDANQDLTFDQSDIVRVLAPNSKYRTGLPATWGEGDWNGAPGGSIGRPPAGNGRFDQLDIMAALRPGHYLKGPYTALNPNGRQNDGQSSIVYDPRTGEILIDAPTSTTLTSINIESVAGIFTGDGADNLGGGFDIDTDFVIFKATFSGSFGTLSFGNVAQTGLSQQFLLDDLSADGSLAGGGALGPIDLVYVPEPSTIVSIMIALVGLLACGLGKPWRSA